MSHPSRGIPMPFLRDEICSLVYNRRGSLWPPQEALGMRKGAIATVAALAVLAAGAGLLHLFELSSAPVAAQTPPAAAPGIPVTGGTVALADVPVFLNAIGTVQASNM